LEKTSRPLKFTTDSNNSMGKSVSYGDTQNHIRNKMYLKLEVFPALDTKITNFCFMSPRYLVTLISSLGDCGLK